MTTIDPIDRRPAGSRLIRRFDAAGGLEWRLDVRQLYRLAEGGCEMLGLLEGILTIHGTTAGELRLAITTTGDSRL